MEVDLYAWTESLDELAAVASRAERAGFRTVWSAELHRSAFVPVAAMAATTSSIGLGSGVALAFARSPMVTALSALDIDELTGGRFILGLGSGVRRLNEDWHGVEWRRPVRRLRETVEIIRALVESSHLGEPLVVEGEVQSIRLRGYERPFKPVRPSIPIHLAAVGPQMTRLAGEIADGWLAHELGSPAFVKERILPHLADGLDRGSRDRKEIDMVASACCVVLPDGQEALRQTAGLVAFYASVRTYTDFFEFHGFGDEARRIQDLFREGDIEGMMEATPDEMVDAVTLSGTPERAREKLATYEGLVDAVKLSPPTHFVEPSATRQAQDTILATFAR